TSFSAALEREMHEPARTLAEAFLIPIAHKEEIDGSLDISHVTLGEFGGELDEISRSYSRLKRSIRDKARDVCLYVTLGELLTEDTLRQQLDMLQAQREADLDRWVELLQGTEVLKTAHRQN